MMANRGISSPFFATPSSLAETVISTPSLAFRTTHSSEKPARFSLFYAQITTFAVAGKFSSFSPLRESTRTCLSPLDGLKDGLRAKTGFMESRGMCPVAR